MEWANERTTNTQGKKDRESEIETRKGRKNNRDIIYQYMHAWSMQSSETFIKLVS